MTAITSFFTELLDGLKTLAPLLTSAFDISIGLDLIAKAFFVFIANWFCVFCFFFLENRKDGIEQWGRLMRPQNWLITFLFSIFSFLVTIALVVNLEIFSFLIGKTFNANFTIILLLMIILNMLGLIILSKSKEMVNSDDKNGHAEIRILIVKYMLLLLCFASLFLFQLSWIAAIGKLPAEITFIHPQHGFKGWIILFLSLFATILLFSWMIESNIRKSIMFFESFIKKHPLLAIDILTGLTLIVNTTNYYLVSFYLLINVVAITLKILRNKKFIK